MRNLSIALALLMLLFVVACEKETVLDVQLDPVLNKSNNQTKPGATQISGEGLFAGSECDFLDKGADFALSLTGDLEGCLYVFVDSHDCSPSGTYREEGTELFVGTYNGDYGTFRTNYKFEAKYEGCEDGFFLGA